MKYKIENELIQIMADTKGGELQSIVKKETGIEYLWYGDASFWGRHAPILFPIVGSLKDKQYRYEGKSYAMSQHGFARDMEFELVKKDTDELWFERTATADTLEKYPFEFSLQLGYKLEDNSIRVIWHVENRDKKTMYFSIGGHPAFLCPIEKGTEQKDYYIRFNTESDVTYGKINEQGLLYDRDNKLELNYGTVRIGEHMFDEDALIFENPDFNQIELLTPKKIPYLRVTSDMPLVGIWSPAGKQAPFVCIEPWCGRCDAVEFEGELKDREYGFILQPGQIFEKSYSITLL